MNKFGKIIAGTLAGILIIGSAGTGLAYKFSPTFKDKVDNVFHIGDKKDELKKQIEELKQQLEIFKNAENTIKTLQSEKAQLQAEKDELQKRFDENQKKIETLQAEKVKLAEDMQVEINELNARIANLEKEQSDLQTRIANLEKRVSVLETQVADLQKQVADKQTQIDKLSDKITDLWSVFENYTIYTDSTDKGETPPATEIKKSDKEALEERISQLEEKVSKLEQNKVDKTTEKQKKQDVINNYNNQKETINNNITNNITIINNNKTTISNNEKTINDYSKTIDSNNTTISNNNNTIKELENKESRTDEEQTTLDNLKKENSDLQAENTTKQSEIENLQTEINTVKAKVADLEKVNQEQQAQVSDIEKRVSELESEVKVIDNDISNLDKSIDSVNSQINKFENFIKNSTIVDDSGTTDPDKPGTTDPSEPDTPSEDFKLEYGKRYFTELQNLKTSAELDEYLSNNSDYSFGSQTDLSDSGMLQYIPSAYYSNYGYKIADKNNMELEKYIQFSYLFFKLEDKQKAINWFKANINAMGDYSNYCNYYLIGEDFIYMEGFVEGSNTGISFSNVSKTIICYERKEGIFIKDNKTGEVVKVYESGRNWNFKSKNETAFAYGVENKGIVAVDMINDTATTLTDNGTWVVYSLAENDISFINSESTKQLTYNIETKEIEISDYKVTEPKILYTDENYQLIFGNFKNSWLNNELKDEANKEFLNSGYKDVEKVSNLQNQDYISDSVAYMKGSQIALFVFYDNIHDFENAKCVKEYIDSIEDTDNCFLDYYIVSDVGAYIEFTGI